MKRKIFVIGDSHTDAIRSAYAARSNDALAASPVEFEVHRFLKTKGETSSGNMAIERAASIIQQLSPNDLTVITSAGTLHNIFGLLRHETPFDFHLSENDKLVGEDINAIPNKVMRDLFYETARNNKNIKMLSTAASCRTFHMSTPSPKEDNSYIQERTTRYRDKLVPDVGINSPEIRLKLWKLEMSVVEELCGEWGIAFLPPPPGSQTEKGYLKRELYGQDATHANEAYGELVLQQLETVALNTPL